jgi:Zn-dependent protease with chaperone function
MISPYVVRLICICLASFFAIHLALGLLVSFASPRLVRFAERICPRRAAALLLLARFFPGGIALAFVAALCIPSYFSLEPDAPSEELGLACLAAATLAILIWTISIARGIHAAARSIRYLHRCRHAGQTAQLPGETSPAVLIDANVPVLALSGVFHHRLVVSRRIVNELSPDQLAAALLHERAHRVSQDNLKRLLLLLAPGILPCWNGFDRLETAWARLAEWAADDRAADGDPHRSLSLAAAIVQVASLGVARQPSPLTTSLLPHTRDLATRVNRLLANTPPPDTQSSTHLLTAVLTCFLSLTPLTFHPAVLKSVHTLLEHLTH